MHANANDSARHRRHIVPGVTPIVVLGDDWGRHVSTSQHLFNRLIGKFPLLWVNSIGQRRPRLSVYDMKRAANKVLSMVSRTKAPRAGQSARQPDGVVNPRALPWHDISAVRALNGWSISRDIRRALNRIAPGERPLLVMSSPTTYPVLGRLNELASIYFCLDDYGQIVGTDHDLLEPLERELLARVDALTATAASLLETKRPKSGRVLHLPQGVNYDHFATPQTMPAEFAALPRPIIGFAGGVGPAIEFELIRALASRFSEASIVLVGPHQQRIEPSAWPANVHFVGPRPYSDLPAYVQAFDVGLIPYVHNAWTRAVDPLKLLEYLAAGIPVAATGLPEVMKYAEAVEVADGPDAFVGAVSLALTKRGGEQRAERQRVAIRNRWESRAEQFIEFAEQVICDKLGDASPASAAR